MLRGMAIYRLAVVVLVGLFSFSAWADYPNKAVRLIVGFPPGGAVDIVARVMGENISSRLGQPVVIENRAGASTNIATSFVARSDPDGYTLLMGTVVNTINPSLHKGLQFDFQKDLAPVTLAANMPFYLFVTPDLPVKSVRELISYAKANPGKLNFGSVGKGSSPHLAAEMFKSLAGVDMVHVPYKGVPLLLNGMFGGEIQVAFVVGPLALPLIKSNSERIRALGVTSAQRSSQAPHLPTMIESGLPGFEINSWIGVLTRAGTPGPIVERLNSEIIYALKQPEVRARFDNQGIDVITSTPEAFRTFIQAEILKHAKIIQDANIEGD